MEKVTTMNDFFDAQNVFKEIAIKFIKDNIVKYENGITVACNDEEYKVVPKDDDVLIFTCYGDFIYNLTNAISFDFVLKIAQKIQRNIRRDNF